MSDINPLLVQESLSVHLFAEGGFLDDLFRRDAGKNVNYMRTDKHLFSLSEDPRKVVDRVLKPIGPKQTIHVLRMVAHGNAGEFMFPGMENAQRVSLEWRRLRNYFDPKARLELHGCGVASETNILKPDARIDQPALAQLKPGTFNGSSNGKGLTFLQKVASVFGLEVTAGIDFQYAESNNWRFEHDTVTVFPNGKFRFDSNESRGMTKADLEEAAAVSLSAIKTDLVNKRLFAEARAHLTDLIRNYPRTTAAAEARTLLETNFVPKPTR